METDKENDSTMATDDEVNTTDQLLDSTYNLKPRSIAYGESPVGKNSLCTHPLVHIWLTNSDLSRLEISDEVNIRYTDRIRGQFRRGQRHRSHSPREAVQGVENVIEVRSKKRVTKHQVVINKQKKKTFIKWFIVLK